MDKGRYVTEMNAELKELESPWINGQGYLVFNLISGTYPDYDDRHINFNAARPILARAGVSKKSYRLGFDISLPNFHESLPVYDNEREEPQSKRHYFIVFKGRF